MQYRDLLRLRYAPNGRDPRSGVDCFWLAQEVCRRVGRELVSEDPLEAQVEHVGDRWQDATELGDLVVTAEHAHVSVLVTLRDGLVLSCGHDRPLVYAVAAWAVPGVVGVWRAPVLDDSQCRYNEATEAQLTSCERIP